jgi:hypothetical protein
LIYEENNDMAEKTIPIAVRMTEELVKQIDAIADNRARFIIDAVRYKLDPESFETSDLTDKEKKDVLRSAKNLHEVMSEALLHEAQRRKNFLAGMSNEDLAKLMAARLPKEIDANSDLEGDVLSLQKCISALPGIPDITEELNRVKLEYSKLAAKYKTAKKLLNHVQHKETFAELMEGIYRFSIEYVVEMVIRNALPGLGDGGGLSTAGYSEISARVKADLEKLKLTGKAGKW